MSENMPGTTQDEHQLKVSILAGELVDAACGLSKASSAGDAPRTVSDGYLEAAALVVECYDRWRDYRESDGWPNAPDNRQRNEHVHGQR